MSLSDVLFIAGLLLVAPHIPRKAAVIGSYGCALANGIIGIVRIWHG